MSELGGTQSPLVKTVISFSIALYTNKSVYLVFE